MIHKTPNFITQHHSFLIKNFKKLKLQIITTKIPTQIAKIQILWTYIEADLLELGKRVDRSNWSSVNRCTDGLNCGWSNVGLDRLLEVKGHWEIRSVWCRRCCGVCELRAWRGWRSCGWRWRDWHRILFTTRRFQAKSQ